MVCPNEDQEKRKVGKAGSVFARWFEITESWSNVVRGQGELWFEVTESWSLGTTSQDVSGRVDLSFRWKCCVIRCTDLLLCVQNLTSRMLPIFLLQSINPIVYIPTPSHAVTPRSLPHPDYPRQQQITTTKILASSCSYSSSHAQKA